jgi:hypothetical protein
LAWNRLKQIKYHDICLAWNRLKQTKYHDICLAWNRLKQIKYHDICLAWNRLKQIKYHDIILAWNRLKQTKYHDICLAWNRLKQTKIPTKFPQHLVRRDLDLIYFILLFVNEYRVQTQKIYSCKGTIIWIQNNRTTLPNYSIMFQKLVTREFQQTEVWKYHIRKYSKTRCKLLLLYCLYIWIELKEDSLYVKKNNLSVRWYKYIMYVA